MSEGGIVFSNIGGETELNLHINHPQLGYFTLTRHDNPVLGIHELEELVRYIKERIGDIDNV